MILFEKVPVQPANRSTGSANRFAREEVSRSTCRPWPIRSGPAPVWLKPLFSLIEATMFAGEAERLHGDDTRVPVLAKGKTITGRLWTYAARRSAVWRPDAAGSSVLLLSVIALGEHPQRHLQTYAGILQADAYGGYTTSFMKRDAERLAWFWKRRAGCTPAGRSSSWPIWRPAPGEKHKARRRRSSRRSRWRRSVASTPCSTSSARSMARTPLGAKLCATN